jgi:hypothetical protein
VITASNAVEYAFEGDQLADERNPQPSVFTAALVEGLATGDADRDEDGWISLNELYDYVFDKVRERNPSQTPSRDVEMQGDVYLARSRRRRIRGVPIPPDLDAARADANMFTRLGAVTELRSRLLGDNVAVAVGAFAALAELAETDIQFVADAAKAALREAAVQPAEPVLHFGRIEQGAAPPSAMVRLLGPPVAKACTPDVSHEWIRVNETPDGFEVSVDTARAAAMRGTLAIKGPTGEAVVVIEADVVPSSAKTASTPARGPADDEIRAASSAAPAHRTGPPGTPAADASLRMPTPPRDMVTADVDQQPLAPSAPATEQTASSQTAASLGHQFGPELHMPTDAAPSMPDIQPAERWSSDPFTVVDEGKYTIGWQYFPDQDGGPSFVVTRRSQFGFLKVVNRYPLTEEGWSSAWRSLTSLDPAAAERAHRVLARRALPHSDQPGRKLERAQAGGSASRPTRTGRRAPLPTVSELAKLAAMVNDGLISREEFEQLKAGLMKNMKLK